MRKRLLFAAYKHDPTDPDAASGSEFHFHRALSRHFDVEVVGPLLRPAAPLERIWRKLYKRITGTRWAKFTLTDSRRASRTLATTVRTKRPDLVFTQYPNLLAYQTLDAPAIYRLDTSFLGWQQGWPEFGRLALAVCRAQERRAFRRAAKIVTHSEWSKHVIVDGYGIDPDKIIVFANPSGLPDGAVPSDPIYPSLTSQDEPLRLLLVGRDSRRKGVDIGIDIVEKLNHSGQPAHLTVCGVAGDNTQHVSFVGPYRKSVPNELDAYLYLYRCAHLLIHPARFEAAGIVPSEAAGFGIPTLTNDVGGLATTVEHGVSGIVLPGKSPAEAYVRAIRDLIDNGRYHDLCRSARARYEAELDWRVAGDRLAQALDSNSVRA
ncbi:MAG: glycosyltransferase family 4 protein [Acidobacteriota bacterium]